MQKPKIIVIVGPTGSGKTSLAITLARKFRGEVISADSRQVYRGLDIGTEKIVPTDMQGIPHHLIDIVDVETVYTATDFKRDAATAITHIRAQGHLPVIAGGTFFYIDTLLGRITTPEVAPNPTLRAELEAKDEASLMAALEKLDPVRAATIDKDNKRRLVRALEIVAALGAVPAITAADCPYEVLMIGIKIDKETLRARLDARAEAALARGLIEETTSLISKGVSVERLREIGLEYRLVLEHLDGACTYDELRTRLTEKNWQYAKRQLTWLKRDQSIEWFSIEDTKSIVGRVATFLS